MKEAMLVGFIGFGLLILGVWFLVVYIANRFTSKEKPATRFVAIFFAILSVPAFLHLYAKYDRYLFENKLKNKLKQERAMARISARHFKELCAEIPPVNINRVVQQAKPIVIRLEESAYSYYHGLEITKNPSSACWLVNDGTRCKRANIGSVEWLKVCDNYSMCKGQKERTFYRSDRNSDKRIEIVGYSSQYVMSASDEEIDPLIRKYKVVVSSTETGEVLAETYIFKKIPYGHFGNPAEWEMELKVPTFCPEANVHIANMLSQVFPVTQDLLKRTLVR